MKRSSLVTSSLLFYWRTHVAVLLGVIAGTAVISGALIVGDSVRESLKRMSLDRLGGVDHALHSPRFFRQETVDGLAANVDFSQRFRTAAPVLIMDGALVREADDGTVLERAGGVTVYGIDERFADLSEFGSGDLPLPTDDEIVLSDRVASQINGKAGDEMTLWVELPSTIPRETLLGGIEDQETQNVPLTVARVLDETSHVGRFDLNPGQQLPMTVFVSLQTLQEAVGLEAARRSRDFPNGKPARINAVFLSSADHADASTEQAAEAARFATEKLDDAIGLDDLDLRVVQGTDRAYVSLESHQMVLENSYAAAAERATRKLGWSTSSVMVYLVNELQNVKDSEAFSTYSIIAGVDFESLRAAPFGPLFSDGQPSDGPGKFEVVLNDWIAADLKVEAGDTISVQYHLVGSHGELPDEVREFKVHSIVSLENSAAAGDSGLTPEVRGITDAKNFRDWKQPFQMDIDRVTDRDDDFWELHRALPKAFVSLETARELWTSRYGSLTSLRAAAPEDLDLDHARTQFVNAFFEELNSTETGLIVQPVKYNGIQAASGTTDFSGLFFGFSFFVIASAMILIGLLFRLGVERRTSSIGLLEAVGFRQRTARSLILCEGMIVSVVGGLLGTGTAIAYAQLMVAALKDPDWWGGAIGTRFLNVYVKSGSLMIGFGIAVFVAAIALVAALRGLKRISTQQLLAGETEPAMSETDLQNFAKRRRKRAKIGAGISAVVITAGLLGIIPASEAFSGLSWQIVAFFLVGITLLTSSMFYLSAHLSADRGSAVAGSGFLGTGRLGLRNAARNRSRSILSTGLIASATFVIVAVAAGRRDPSIEKPDITSGNGGFALVAESTSPILDDLSTADGRDTLAVVTDEDSPDAKLLHDMAAYSFRVRPGENASCLNLYQTTLPKILGVPDELSLERGGFRFVDQRKADYWKLINEAREDGNVPVLGDMNTLMYSLHKGPGSTIDLPGTDRKLAVVGMLDSSVFQGVLLMSDANFQELFPEQTGYRYFLIGASDERVAAGGHFSDEEVDRLSSRLEASLTPYGFDAARVTDRIAAFLIVQNTYLSTFQSLGGLGLLLGTFGLATVMLRNVVERRAELALFRAVGFRRGNLAIMVLSENAMLLIWGLVAGTLCAIVAMLPHLLSIGADTPWADGIKLLGLVFATGMVAAMFAVREASKTPIVSTLRGE